MSSEHSTLTREDIRHALKFTGSLVLAKVLHLEGSLIEMLRYNIIRKYNLKY